MSNEPRTICGIKFGIREIGIIFCALGLILTIFVLLTLGNNPANPPLVIALCAEITLGLYFLGLSVVSQTYIGNYDRALLVEEIKKIVQPNFENKLSEFPKDDEITRKKKIDQVTLELNLESIVLTAVSVASAVEVGFIGLLGPSDIRTIIISILFVILMGVIYCQYKCKLVKIKEIFKN